MQTQTSATILVVEDDRPTLELLMDELLADGYSPIAADSEAKAMRLLAGSYPDAVIVDVGLPDGSGLDLVRHVREPEGADSAVDPDLPVLVLSGRCGESDRVRAFECGADDFLAKPFSYRELRGRLQALLRRRERFERRGRLRVGGLSIDTVTREVRIGDQPIELTQKEFSLLRMLAGEPARVFTKDELLRTIWGFRAPGATTTRTLDSHACRLRGKLARAGGGAMVQNVWGVGYRLNDQSAALEPVA